MLQQSSGLGVRMRVHFPASACLLLLRRRIPTPTPVRMLPPMSVWMLPSMPVWMLLLQMRRQTLVTAGALRCTPVMPYLFEMHHRGSLPNGLPIRQAYIVCLCAPVGAFFIWLLMFGPTKRPVHKKRPAHQKSTEDVWCRGANARSQTLFVIG